MTFERRPSSTQRERPCPPSGTTAGMHDAKRRDVVNLKCPGALTTHPPTLDRHRIAVRLRISILRHTRPHPEKVPEYVGAMPLLRFQAESMTRRAAV